MPSEYENMAKNIMSSPQGLRIIQSLDKLSAMAASQSERQLISMLAGNGGDGQNGILDTGSEHAVVFCSKDLRVRE